MGKAKQTDDELVLLLIKKVRDQKTEIKKLAKPNWLTSCTIGFSDSVADRVNIMTQNKPEQLVAIYVRLLSIEEKWEQSNQELGLDVPVVHQGYAIADWKTDIKTRAGQLTIEKKKRELETLEKRLDGLITVEQRRTLELAAIQQELGEA